MSSIRRYTVEYDRQALKELGKLDKPVAKRVVRTVNELGDDPRPPGCRALTSYPGLWRIRVGHYRMVYTIKDAELIVLALRVARRSAAYRNL